MPFFVIISVDRPGRLENRKKTRSEHLEYLNTIKTKIICAGPFITENEIPCGTMLMIVANDLNEAEKIAANDPYIKAGVFESTTVRPWKYVLGNGLNEMRLE